MHEAILSSSKQIWLGVGRQGNCGSRLDGWAKSLRLFKPIIARAQEKMLEGRCPAPAICINLPLKRGPSFRPTVEGATKMRTPTRLLARTFICLVFAALSISSARAQYKIELQTCEDLKITKKQYGANVVETATCVNPTKNFKPKGTLRNVFVLSTFPAQPGRASRSW